MYKQLLVATTLSLSTAWTQAAVIELPSGHLSTFDGFSMSDAGLNITGAVESITLADSSIVNLEDTVFQLTADFGQNFTNTQGMVTGKSFVNGEFTISNNDGELLTASFDEGWALRQGNNGMLDITLDYISGIWSTDLSEAGLGGVFEFGNDFNNVTNDRFDGDFGAISQVPLPAGAWLLLSGLGLLTARARLKR